MELLAPAGSISALKAAVSNGADAVYLGLDLFNARAKAENFTIENIKEHIDFCHLYGVKVYIAFKAKHTNIFDCAFTKKKLKVWLNLRWNELCDIPSELSVIDVSNIGHHGNGDYQFDISSESEIEMLVPLIRKTYEKKTGQD